MDYIIMIILFLKCNQCMYLLGMINFSKAKTSNLFVHLLTSSNPLPPVSFIFSIQSVDIAWDRNRVGSLSHNLDCRLLMRTMCALIN